MPNWQALSRHLFQDLDLDKSQTYNYLSRFKKIKEYFDDRTFDRKNIQEFIYHLKDQYSASTVGLYIILLKHICKVKGLDYMTGFKLPKRKRVYKEILTPKEMEQVLTLGYSLNFRYTLAIELSLRLGFRVGTIRSLQWKDVHNDYVVIRDQKDDIDKPKSLDRDLYNKLNQLQRHKHGYVFGSHNGLMTPKLINTFLRDVLKRLNINKRMSFHDLRHSCATTLHDNGVDIRFIQEQLDHKNITTTEIYTHVSVEGLRKILKKHPLAYNSLQYSDIIVQLREIADIGKKSGYKTQIIEGGNRTVLSVENKMILS